MRVETPDQAAPARGARGGVRGLAARLGAWIDALSPGRGTAALVALSLVVWALQSLVWPVVAGRDLGTYLRYYSQMWEWDAVLPQAMLGRTPGAPLILGATLELGGLAVEILMAGLFVASIVAWTVAAASFDRRAAALVAGILLLYPGYGALFHQFSSDALSAAGFAFWALAAVRVCLRPSAMRFGLLGAGLVALILVRPANQALLAFALAPLVLAGTWRERLGRSGTFLGVAVALLVAWSGHNAIRYGDFTVARGSSIVVPFARAFTEERIVSPENGPSSRALARAVEQRLLIEEPYRSYGIDLETFFGSGSSRMLEDAASLTDRSFGWDEDYAILREAGVEAVRAHPGTYAEGVVRTMWQLLRGPAYVVASGSTSSSDEDRGDAPGEGEGEGETIVVAGRVLPRPSEGEPIPGSHQALWVSTPDDRIREVWSSPTEHRLVFREPGDEARADHVQKEISRLTGRLPDRAGSATLGHRLNQVAYRFPPPFLWLAVGLVALAWRRPRDGRIALVLAGAGLLVLLASALGLPATAEYAMPVVPAFALLAGVGLLGRRDDRRSDGDRLAPR
ncbi:MAG: glycosyltransferase family 39 protein [Gaiellaceae bacterium]